MYFKFDEFEPLPNDHDVFSILLLDPLWVTIMGGRERPLGMSTSRGSSWPCIVTTTVFNGVVWLVYNGKTLAIWPSLEEFERRDPTERVALTWFLVPERLFRGDPRATDARRLGPRTSCTDWWGDTSRAELWKAMGCWRSTDTKPSSLRVWLNPSGTYTWSVCFRGKLVLRSCLTRVSKGRSHLVGSEEEFEHVGLRDSGPWTSPQGSVWSPITAMLLRCRYSSRVPWVDSLASNDPGWPGAECRRAEESTVRPPSKRAGKLSSL